MPEETPDEWTIVLDVDTLTLGEMWELEKASGQDCGALLVGGRASRRMAAIFIHRLRSSGVAPSWRSLGDLRPPVK